MWVVDDLVQRSIKVSEKELKDEIKDKDAVDTPIQKPKHTEIFRAAHHRDLERRHCAHEDHGSKDDELPFLHTLVIRWDDVPRPFHQTHAARVAQSARVPHCLDEGDCLWVLHNSNQQTTLFRYFLVKA